MTMFRAVVVSCLLAVVMADNMGPLSLVKLSDPEAKCLDGSPGAFYVRRPSPGVKKYVLFFEGGGWCNPGANCASRALTGLGSSTTYPPTIASTGYEGGSGFLSGNSSITLFADFGVVYMKYCSGGSFTGQATDPMQVGNQTLWYRGQYILNATITELEENYGLKDSTDIVIAGCSAGGMACYLHCDPLASRLSYANSKCICDAGVFQDLVALTGTRVVRGLYSSIYQAMNTSNSLIPECKAAHADNPGVCMFPQYVLPFLRTPTFMLNSMYNFMTWETGIDFFPSWKECVPNNGGITPQSYAKCNATQQAFIQNFRHEFINNTQPMWDPKTDHGCMLSSCPNQHCETSTGWNMVTVQDTLMRDAVAAWYQGKPVKLIDSPFGVNPNPTCGYSA